MARNVLILSGVLLLGLLACKPNPADCYEKGDEKACQAICDTGEEGSLMACYEMRARQVEACVDGKGDCQAACTLWTGAVGHEDVEGFYVAKLGSEEKVAAIRQKCATPAP